jgi:DNA-directed RNA polymerase beta subunit
MLAVFRALGFHTKDDIEDFLWDDPNDSRRRMVAAMYEDPLLTMPLDEVFTFMGHGMYNEHDLTPEKCRNQVLQQIKGELLPHVGFDDEPKTKFKKAVYLRIIMLHMLDVYLGRAEPDDRDFEGTWAYGLMAPNKMCIQLFQCVAVALLLRFLYILDD